MSHAELLEYCRKEVAAVMFQKVNDFHPPTSTPKP